MKKIIILFFSFLASFSFFGCKTETLENKETIKIFVSILPQKYFVERIGGENVEVQVMVKPGASPATYEPTIKQMMDLKKADVFFRIGVPFENSWIEKIQAVNPNMKIIDTRKNIVLRAMEKFEEGDVKKEVHDHSKVKDPHIWLSPQLVEIQAETIKQALSEIKPERKDFFQNNLNIFQKELRALEVEIQNYFQTLKHKEFLVFHPSWGYFAKAFGLKQFSVEIEGKEPMAKELIYIIKKAKAKNIKVIFVQKQFSKTQAQSVAEQIGGVVIEIDPLAENYLENLRNIGKTISHYLQNQENTK